MARYDIKECEVCQKLIPPRAKVCRFCEAANTPSESTGSYNKFGIPRDIPADVARTVRMECGFGCVICGELPIEYEHFDPPYVEEKEEHKAQGIALLCLPHHRQREGRPPSLQAHQVRLYRDNPKCKQSDFVPVYPKFFISPGPRGIRLGSMSVNRGAVRVRANGQNFIWFDEADVGDLHRPVLLGMHLEDEKGETWLEIEDNVLSIAPSISFDIQCEGARVTITAEGRTILKMERYEMESVLPPEAGAEFESLLPSDDWENLASGLCIDEPINVLTVQEADTWCGGKHIQITANQVLVDGQVKFAGNIQLQGLNAATSAVIEL